MKAKIELNWKDNMAFKTNIDGHDLLLDAAPTNGGNDLGPRPKQLMLVALAGCTGMDVVSMLKKMRVNIKDFKVSVEADTTEEHPKHYSQMTVIYEFWGENLSEEKIAKAVNLSEERYCGVSHVYKKAMKVDSKIIIHE